DEAKVSGLAAEFSSDEARVSGLAAEFSKVEDCSPVSTYGGDSGFAGIINCRYARYEGGVWPC
ncbi:MAG: hypothetical protein ACK524_11995, partial [Planctomyces sp.]